MTRSNGVPQQCVAVSAAPDTVIHLASVDDTHPGDPTLCGSTVRGTERARRFLVDGCPHCARSALARGYVAAADASGAVSLSRVASDLSSDV